MSSFSAEYLRNLPIQKRKEFVQLSCEQYTQRILQQAANGNTNILIDQNNNQKNNLNVGMHTPNMWMATPPSAEEIIEYLKEKFPDCKVSYEEQWHDVAPGRRELKKGILVDWS
jgi:hypothetical protein